MLQVIQFKSYYSKVFVIKEFIYIWQILAILASFHNQFYVTLHSIAI